MEFSLYQRSRWNLSISRGEAIEEIWKFFEVWKCAHLAIFRLEYLSDGFEFWDEAKCVLNFILQASDETWNHLNRPRDEEDMDFQS